MPRPNASTLTPRAKCDHADATLECEDSVSYVPRLALRVRLRARPHLLCACGLGLKDMGDPGRDTAAQCPRKDGHTQRLARGDGDAASPSLVLEERAQTCGTHHGRNAVRCNDVSTRRTHDPAWPPWPAVTRTRPHLASCITMCNAAKAARVPQARIRASRCVCGWSCVGITSAGGAQWHDGDGVRERAAGGNSAPSATLATPHPRSNCSPPHANEGLPAYRDGKGAMRSGASKSPTYAQRQQRYVPPSLTLSASLPPRTAANSNKRPRQRRGTAEVCASVMRRVAWSGDAVC
ncbi:hypothetical protein B0H10DRAFT_2211403 [Mycena sp. CBHHK59/15]|nr:hypothetical protein B0H10DRAFT_2211403 [Mycena sp. CBHHK59/15]